MATSVWNGSSYVVFGSTTAAMDYAKRMIKEFADQQHPMGDVGEHALITENCDHKWWACLDTGTEADPIQIGDASPEAEAMVTSFWEARERAWNSLG